MKVSLILPYYNRKQYLHAALQSFNILYKGKDLEIVVVDDCSDEAERPDDLYQIFKDFNIHFIRLEEKSGVNPCYPYNLGVRAATGDVLVLSSPETLHTTSIFDLCNDFKDLTQNQYYCFSVFCPTRPEINDLAMLCNTPERLRTIRDKVELRAYSGLGDGGRDNFNNDAGSWYLHSKYRKTELNFLTAIKRETFYELAGFDERFRKTTAFDDNEFRDRLVAKIGIENVVYFDNALALHLNHKAAYGSGNPIGNYDLYHKTIKSDPYLPNDNWGKI